jgi:hypothetical protein
MRVRDVKDGLKTRKEGGPWAAFSYLQIVAQQITFSQFLP